MAQISWMEWGKEAFDRAEQETRLILLWLTGPWCQWSREMERSTFTRPDVVGFVNDYYIPIQVDAARRPDIDLRYNQGGLPSTVIIVPSGELLSGGTYFTSEQMALALSRTLELYRASKDELVRESRAATEQLVAYERATVEPGAVLDRAQVVMMMRSLLERTFDAEYGGFAIGEVKFPHLNALTFLLHQYYYTGEERCREMVMKTLDVIGDSSFYDPEEGGVFRYSTTRDWNEPSSEKMLEDNVGFLRLYLETYQLTGLDRYRAKAEEILGYISTTLMDREGGGFYGSQASDEQYYLMPLAERRKRLAPRVDTTLLTSANGRAMATFCYAADVLERADLLEHAARAAERLLANSLSEGMGMYRYTDGAPSAPGLLVDQVPMALALISLGDATGGREYLARAETLAAYMVRHLLDEADGKFRDAPEDGAALGNLKVVRKPFEPNTEVVRLLHELHLRTGSSHYDELAEKLLLALRQRYLDVELQGAGFAETADYTARPTMVATVIGKPEDSGTAALRRAAAIPYYPKKILRVVDPDQAPEELSRAGVSATELPVLILSKGEGRGEPLRDPAAAAPAVEALAAELRGA